MEHRMDDGGPGGMVERLCRATNDHDLEALASCFAIDFRNETPAHPARSFRGRQQVRQNWQQIFAGVPDISARVRWIADETSAWSEWEMSGTRRDGAPHLFRGVVIFVVANGQARSARLYLEPVQEGDGDVNDAVGRAVAVDASREPGPSASQQGAAR